MLITHLLFFSWWIPYFFFNFGNQTNCLLLLHYERYDDDHLLSLMRTGDAEAFTALYRRYWKPLFFKAAKKLDDLAAAEEIVQDIFLDLWRRRTSLCVTGEFSHYLATAVKFKVINRQANEARHQHYLQWQTGSVEIASQNTGDAVLFREMQEQLAKLVAALPEKCRLAYQLREEGYSQQEISWKMQISENTVETHIRRALKALRLGMRKYISLFFLYFF